MRLGTEAVSARDLHRSAQGASSRWSRLAGLLFAAIASPVFALSYLPIGDGPLFDAADTVVAGRIVAVDARDETTAYGIDVDEVLKGSAQGGPLRVVVPGSAPHLPSGTVVSGAPQYVLGESVLLFLTRRASGEYGVTELALGSFHVRAHPEGGEVLVRDLSSAHSVAKSGAHDDDPEARGAARDALAFRAWLRAHGAGGAPAPEYWREASGGGALMAKYTLGSTPVRWFEFDSGRSVTIHASDIGLLGLIGGGYSQLRAAIDAWNADPQSNVRLAYGGLISLLSALFKPDGVNNVVFNDPHDDIPGTYSCTRGGVLATAAYRYSGTQIYNGRSYGRITEADIVVQDGVGCLLSKSGGIHAAELFAHELGHVLGLGHSCGDANSPDCVSGSDADEAVMRATIHADGRGARLGTDDRAALKVVYPAAASGTEPTATAPDAGTAGSGSGGGSSGGGGAFGGAALLALLLGAATRRRG